MRAAVHRDFPEFKEVLTKVRGEEHGLLKFEWRPKDGLICALAFRPLSEGFDAWVGWSTNGKFPYAIAKNPRVGAKDPNDFRSSSAMFLTMVIANRAGTSYWKFWRPDDATIDDPMEYAKQFEAYCVRALDPLEAKKMVCGPVEAAMLEVKNYGIPYLRNRSEYSG